jgi:hypothetical protein
MQSHAMSQLDLIREPVLDPAECARAVDEIVALRTHWTPRAGIFPFFSFGAASYMDAAAAPARYLDLAATCNPLLRERFGWLLERVKQTISHRLGLEAEWFPRGALPGFHIYLAHDIFALPVASVHYDRQYLLLDWRDMGEPDFDQPVSFTLPISLPAAGSGLNTWPMELDPDDCQADKAIHAIVRDVAPTPQAYRLGEMVMHSGHMLHQAAPAPFAHPDERRITLQGHAIKAGGRLYLYW